MSGASSHGRSPLILARRLDSTAKGSISYTRLILACMLPGSVVGEIGDIGSACSLLKSSVSNYSEFTSVSCFYCCESC